AVSSIECAARIPKRVRKAAAADRRSSGRIWQSTRGSVREGRRPICTRDSEGPNVYDAILRHEWESGSDEPAPARGAAVLRVVGDLRGGPLAAGRLRRALRESPPRLQHRDPHRDLDRVL